MTVRERPKYRCPKCGKQFYQPGRTCTGRYNPGNSQKMLHAEAEALPANW